MTIFVSQRANRDPLPWVWRDPIGAFAGRAGAAYTPHPGDSPGWSSTFDPRHDESDPPVNRILQDFRYVHAQGNPWSTLLDGLDSYDFNKGWPEATAAEIAHARRVLTLLAKIGE